MKLIRLQTSCSPTLAAEAIARGLESVPRLALVALPSNVLGPQWRTSDKVLVIILLIQEEKLLLARADARAEYLAGTKGVK